MKIQVKGFTLIELLIVIAILAILASAVLIVINPAELLRRSRDSKRIQDLDTVKNAVNLYLADRGSLADLSGGSSANAKCETATTTPTLFYSLTAFSGCTTPANGSPSNFASCTFSATNTQKTDGTGWIPINFSLVSGGSPLAVEPIDPTNTGTSGTTGTHLYYAYACDSADMTFELTANMESKAFSYSGSNDVESKDGGKFNTVYEVGTKLGIITSTSTYFYGSE